MRLIDSTKLIDALPIVAEDKKISLMGAVADMVMLISEQPVIEAEPVVRCRDCKHWLKDVPGCTDFVGRCELANYMVGATGYCVYGERRADK